MLNTIYSYLEKISIRAKLFIVLGSVCSVTVLLGSVSIINVSIKQFDENFEREQLLVYEYMSMETEHYMSLLNRKIGFVADIDRVGIGDRQSVQAVLKRAITGNSDMLGAYTVDGNGRIINKVYVDRAVEPETLQNDEAYKKARVSGRVQVGAVTGTGNKPVIAIAYPLSRSKGLLYILFGFDMLEDAIGRIAKTGGMQFYVLNRNGEVLFSSSPLSAGKAFRKLDLALHKKQSMVTDPNGAVLKASVNRGKIEDSFVVIGRDAAAVSMPVRLMKLMTIFWLLVTFGILYLLSIIFSGYLLTPILNLVNGMKMVGSGNLNYKANVNSGDEIGFLARTFNSMVEELKQVRSESLHSKCLAAIRKMSEKIGLQIRNPMMTINMAAAMLLRYKGRELNLDDLKKFTAIIRKEASVISKVSDNLLIYANERPPVKNDISIRNLFDEVSALAQIKYNTTLKQDVNGDIHFQGDAFELRCALVNLVDNAIDALQETGGEVILGTEEIDGKIKMWVFDNGPGIGEALLSQIFEPLFTTKPQNMGLGLTVAKKIAERHNATLDVESRVMSGTRFVIQFDKAGGMP